tara:strand:- start:300 stop:749 length:450 start_codon:yes stop_codon:yes gene_type:complete
MGMDNYNDVIPTGRYRARIINVECNSNVRFGNHISDVYKPVYAIEDNKHLSLKGKRVKDNGIFVYKRHEGFQFEPKRNWGYSKYLKMMKISKVRDNNTGMIAPLTTNDVIHNVVNIDVFEKSFTNDFSQYVKYNVARAVELIKKGEVPF